MEWKTVITGVIVIFILASMHVSNADESNHNYLPDPYNNGELIKGTEISNGAADLGRKEERKRREDKLNIEKRGEEHASIDEKREFKLLIDRYVALFCMGVIFTYLWKKGTIKLPTIQYAKSLAILPLSLTLWALILMFAVYLFPITYIVISVTFFQSLKSRVNHKLLGILSVGLWILLMYATIIVIKHYGIHHWYPDMKDEESACFNPRFC